MLSRIAGNLFWMGRYLERTEHISRYAQTHYFFSIDAPKSVEKDHILESVLNMAGSYVEYLDGHGKMETLEVAHFIGLNEFNAGSIKHSVMKARENARGAKDSISSELWQSVNTYYHYVNSMDKATFAQIGIYEFSKKVLEDISVIKANIDNSLLHDEVWSIIHLGQHIERATQVIRMIVTKINDINRIPKKEYYNMLELFENINLLKSTQAYDMCKIYYREVPSISHSLEFLTLNRNFPNSIVYNLRHIENCLMRITNVSRHQTDSLEFYASKLLAMIQYTSLQEIEKEPLAFYHDLLNRVAKLADMLEKKYLQY
ncbi:MAG: alpha-E domain-containing protein [Cytophaga sp.]|uniref:alpha-E domain-containing protein n=1 Tax=Cytophaga sp. TaxID=29535 RepID=UPI003F7D2DDD